jgi:hypothetical protein
MRIRHFLLMVGALLLAAASAAAQDLSNKVQVVYSLSPRPHITATNAYSSPLTGMVVTMDSAVPPKRTYEVIWYDSGVYFTQFPPLASGQSYTFPVGPLNQAPNLQPHLWAVAFQDGESFGDPHWLAELHARREAAYQEIGTVSALLNQALAQRESSEQVISTLNSMRASLTASIPDPLTRIAAGFVVDWAIANLQPPRGPGRFDTDPQRRIPNVILPFFVRWRAALTRTDPASVK